MVDEARLEETAGTNSLQQELERIWKDKTFMAEGLEVTLTESLPEGMRMIQPDSNFYVLRSPIPGVPRDPKTGKPKDVPIGVFGPNVNPKEIKKRVGELVREIQEGNITYVPPENLKK